jgi:hypothetical protein
VSRLSRQCGILNISQHYRPPRPVTGIAFLSFFFFFFYKELKLETSDREENVSSDDLQHGFEQWKISMQCIDLGGGGEYIEGGRNYSARF